MQTLVVENLKVTSLIEATSSKNTVVGISLGACGSSRKTDFRYEGLTIVHSRLEFLIHDFTAVLLS